jgi:hypothetical protein
MPPSCCAGPVENRRLPSPESLGMMRGSFFVAMSSMVVELLYRSCNKAVLGRIESRILLRSNDD